MDGLGKGAFPSEMGQAKAAGPLVSDRKTHLSRMEITRNPIEQLKSHLGSKLALFRVGALQAF